MVFDSLHIVVDLFESPNGVLEDIFFGDVFLENFRKNHLKHQRNALFVEVLFESLSLLLVFGVVLGLLWSLLEMDLFRLLLQLGRGAVFFIRFRHSRLFFSLNGGLLFLSKVERGLFLGEIRRKGNPFRLLLIGLFFGGLLWEFVEVLLRKPLLGQLGFA